MDYKLREDWWGNKDEEIGEGKSDVSAEKLEKHYLQQNQTIIDIRLNIFQSQQFSRAENVVRQQIFKIQGLPKKKEELFEEQCMPKQTKSHNA